MLYQMVIFYQITKIVERRTDASYINFDSELVGYKYIHQHGANDLRTDHFNPGPTTLNLFSNPNPNLSSALLSALSFPIVVLTPSIIVM